MRRRSMKAVVCLAPWVALLVAAWTCGAEASVCSSLNGPFCTGVSQDFPAPPLQVTANLDRPATETKALDLERRLKIENVLKQYELEAARDGTRQKAVDRLLDEIDELINDADAWLEENMDNEDDSSLVGSFAFSSSGDTYDLLESMDGKKMKEFFEMAFEEVLRSWEGTLEDISPELPQGLRGTIDALKELQDHSAYDFQHVEEATLASIRQRFENHRLIEVQRLFERVIVAKTPHERNHAVESIIFMFQLCDEYTPSTSAAASADSSSTALETEETSTRQD